MGALKGLQPAGVYRFFEEIAKIPHGSYHVDEISDYLVAFAKERNLKVVQDELKNVVIYKAASDGYEDEETIIIQGHMDMVAVQDADAPIDITKDPLMLMQDGNYIFAKGTSLGADDGIAVAYALAILDDDSLKHPALEVVITVNEEVGLGGAIGLNGALLSGKRMLNIDSEEEGIFTAGCAGGMSCELKLPFVKEERRGCVCTIEISGLLGGHSGVMIHHGRANANVLMGRLWMAIGTAMDYRLISANGGEKGNAIPTDSVSTIVIDEENTELLQTILQNAEVLFRKEFEGKETEIFVTVEIKPAAVVSCMDKTSTEKCKHLLVAQPDGVQVYSGVVDGLVETSLNMGIMRTNETDLLTHYDIRSSRKSGISAVRDKVKIIGEILGGAFEELTSYPEWEYCSDSPLRDKMVDVYKEVYGREPKIDIIHAGLECGVFAEKIEGFDAVSFGPNILDIHTTKERLDIESTKRVWDFLLRLLETKDKK